MITTKIISTFKIELFNSSVIFDNLPIIHYLQQGVYLNHGLLYLWKKPSQSSKKLHAFFIYATLLKATPGWNWQKIKQILSNTMRINFCYLKIFHILPPRCHPKIIGHILKNKQKNKYLFIHETIRLIITKIKIKIKNRSHRYDTNRSRFRPGHR